MTVERPIVLDPPHVSVTSFSEPVQVPESYVPLSAVMLPKLEPLIIKKTISKPFKDIIKNRDGSISNVLRQSSVITSIENIPIKNKQNKNLVKQKTTKIYTTLTKNINGDEFDNIKDNNSNHSYDEIQKFKDLKKEQNIIPNNINESNFIGSDMNSNSLYSNYEDIEPNNTMRINEKLKYIKYLYYRCTNLNSKIKAKNEALSNYFLKLSDEEKITILTDLKHGANENKDMYLKLLNILKKNNNNKIDTHLNSNININNILNDDLSQKDNNIDI